MIIVSFFTRDTEYEQEARELRQTLKAHNLKYKIYPVDSKGSWEQNCAQKSTIILQALTELKDNILYLDSDARVLRPPPFEQIEKDVPGYGLVQWPHKLELCSGTIYFPNNEVSKFIVKRWVEEQLKNTKEWDQRVLQRIYEETEHFSLPLDWINIAGKSANKKLLGSDNPIILHTQASRRLKRLV